MDMMPSHDERRTCLQDLIATAAEYRHRPIPLMFSRAWGGRFRTPSAGEEPYTIGHRLDAQFDTAFEELNLHHGIDIRLVQGADSRQVLERIMTSVLVELPVIVYMDQYHTPWLPAYGTHHREHYVLVTAVQEQDAMLHCIDPVFSKKQESLPFADFLEGNNGESGIIRFHDDTQDVDITTWLDRLRSKLWDGEHGSVFDAIHRLADAVQDERFAMRQEAALTSGQAIWLTPLLWNIIHMVRGRECFGISVTYLGEKLVNRAFVRLNEQLGGIVEAWADIRDTFLKMAYLSRIPAGYTDKLADQLRRVAELERAAAEVFFHDTQHRSVDRLQAYEQPQSSYVRVELSDYFNNMAFGDISSGASFTWHEGNEHFLLEHSNGETALRELAVGRGTDDNVSCLGQPLSVPVGNYRLLALIGCSEVETAREDLRVGYEDGSEEAIAVGLTYWGAVSPAFGEHVFWEGNAVSYHDGEPRIVEGKKLFEQHIVIDSTKRLVGITLPFQPNVHVFAINLYATDSEGGNG